MEGEGMMRGEFSRKHSPAVKIVGIVSLAVVLLAAVLSDTIYEKVADSDNVSVVGRGKVEYRPDVANATLGVRVDNAATAEIALRQLNDKASKVIESVKALGIPEEHIKTQNYSLYPQYTYPSEGGPSYVSGYSATEQVMVKIEKTDGENAGLVSKVIEEAGKAGTNEIQGVTFEVKDIEKLKQKAREEAIKDAKKQSKDIAKAAGIRLGKIVGWYETLVQSPENPSPMYYGGMGGGMMEAKGGASPQIPSGTGEIIIDMSVTFEIK